MTLGFNFDKIRNGYNQLKIKIGGAIKLWKNSEIPLYDQLMSELEREIDKGRWKKGEKIPSERVLSQMYDVSRITVRAAIEKLARAGMLERIQGKGTFVSDSKIKQELGNLYSFTEEIKKQGKISHTKVLELSVVPADEITARKLDIEYKEDIIYLKRVRYDANEVALFLEKSYFPYEKYQFLLEENLEKNSLYEILNKKYKINFDNAVEKFKATKLLKSEKVILDTRDGDDDFGLLIRRTTYNNSKVEYYSTIITHGDIFEFEIELGKNN